MASNLLEFRKNSGLSIEEIAERIGISVSHYLLIEENQIPPSRILAQKFLKLLNFSFGDAPAKRKNIKNKNSTELLPENIMIDEQFLHCVSTFKLYLNKLKAECDKFNKVAKNTEQQKQWIQEHRAEIFAHLDRYFHDIWNLYQKLPEEQINKHRAIYQNLLQPSIFLCSLNEYIYDKPLGYPGDYIMMDYLYDDGYIGDTIFSKLIHRYSCSIPVARANINRRWYFRDKIKQAMSLNKENSRVMSVACGPAIEIQDYLKHEMLPANYLFTCFDFEPLSLSHIKKHLDSIQIKTNKKFNVNLIHGDIRHLIRNPEKETELGNQDLIYASGLTDYLGDRFASRVISALFKMLAPGGTLIVVNVFSNDVSRAYYELIGEWHLNRRNHGEMLRLAEGIKDAAKIFIEEENETKMNLFLNIQKRQSPIN